MTVSPIRLNERLVLGAGRTKIIAPLVGGELAHVLKQAQDAESAGADLLEWRIDLFDEHTDGDAVIACLRQLSDAHPGLPLLATVRTPDQGGRARVDASGYVELLEAVVAADRARLVDVEHRHPMAEQAIARIHRAGALVVGSHHDFAQTPTVEVMESWLREQDRLGCDVCKIAVMPRSRLDLIALLDATAHHAQASTRPLIAMSMGRLGVASRLIGGEVGSCATFASVGEGSAPGQLPIGELRHVLAVLENPAP